MEKQKKGWSVESKTLEKKKGSEGSGKKWIEEDERARKTRIEEQPASFSSHPSNHHL